jgi:hypothetical protein
MKTICQQRSLIVIEMKGTMLNQYSKDLESFRTGEGQATEPEPEYSSST